VGIDLEVLRICSPQEFDRAFLPMSDKGVGAAIVLNDVRCFNERTRRTALAAQSQIPVMYGKCGFVEAGGLLAHSPKGPELFRRAATYVDKILHGAKPADRPVERPTKVELVLNLKTAKALGLTMPPTLLGPLDLTNMRVRVWFPTFQRAGLTPRNLYQTRHTFASLILQAGEDPAWIARIMGHTTTEMLFERYGRFIQYRTRHDGAAYLEASRRVRENRP